MSKDKTTRAGRGATGRGASAGAGDALAALGYPLGVLRD